MSDGFSFLVWRFFREAVKASRAQPSVLALLEDRIALGEKCHKIGKDGTGKGYVFPLADPDNVDTRRANMGLAPLRLYVKRWGTISNSEYKLQLPLLMKNEGIEE